MDSLEKEQLFDAITVAIQLDYSNAARYVYYDALKLVREEVIEAFIDLALRKDALYLIRDIQKMKEELT